MDRTLIGLWTCLDTETPFPLVAQIRYRDLLSWGVYGCVKVVDMNTLCMATGSILIIYIIYNIYNNLTAYPGLTSIQSET